MVGGCRSCGSPWLAGHLVGSLASGLSCTSLLCLDMARWASQLLRGDAGLSLTLVSAQGCSLIGFLLCLSKAFLFLFFVLLPGRCLYFFFVFCIFSGIELFVFLKALRWSHASATSNLIDYKILGTIRLNSPAAHLIIQII